MERRYFLKTGAAVLAMAALPFASRFVLAADGNVPTVWYWKECNEANLLKATNKIKDHLTGKIAIKVHTGEPHGPRAF